MQLLLIAGAVFGYSVLALLAASVIGTAFRAGRGGPDLPDAWNGSHPYMPGGSPAGEADR